MIDEKKLIELLKIRAKNHIQDSCDLNGNIYNISTEEMILRLADECEAIIELIEGMTKTDKWIPCSERLPERKNRTKISETVIATYLSIFDKRPLCDAFVYYDYDENIWLWDDNGDPVLVDIVAWHPLPEPYKQPAPKWKESMMKHFVKVE